MTIPDREILRFLQENGVAEPERLQVAVVFAQSMVLEMKATLAQWEAALSTLTTRLASSKSVGG